MGSRPRPRDIGLAIGQGKPGPLNALTDVPGVAVGHVTLCRGEGPLQVGQGPVRTGVTAILPHGGCVFQRKVRAAVHVINGFGKAAGLSQVRELGVIETPLVLTNTLSVGVAWDALCSYVLGQDPTIGVSTGTVNPVVAECNDGYLNDIRGGHVSKADVLSALNSAVGGRVREGNVGAGTGMSCLGYKGGIGTSSRRLEGALADKHLGVLVLANFGGAGDLIVTGVPVGALAPGQKAAPAPPPGSIVMVVATDAPLSERQLGRLAKRCQGGLARTGSYCSNGSGDFVIAFSTANQVAHDSDAPFDRIEEPFVRDDSKEMSFLFRYVIEATEEAILSALFAADAMVGRDGHERPGLPISFVTQILRERSVI